MQIIYIEKNLKSHPRVDKIVGRFGEDAKIIYCEHYGEVFNPKSQNFRLQKRQPALILAEKQGNLVLPTPESFGIGGLNNFYFSHMLNCLYDCRYCFLQGMYPSANYVVFVNYESFMQAIEDKITAHPDERCYFFSGYDADSLAYEPVTGFIQEFVPFFARHPHAMLELRTKSANVSALLKQTPIPNVVVAFSFTPHEISTAVEHKVPSVAKRVDSMLRLAQAGWSLGLRFDPIIDTPDFEKIYSTLIESIFSKIDTCAFHSVSVGTLRFPVNMHKKIVKLYPEEPLLAQSFAQRAGVLSYPSAREQTMKQFILDHLKHYLPSTQVFECQV